ncbi:MULTISPECIES: putative quinol monooxygenase [Brevundimonas]|uniref:putative quinol monooxygenase n=1 Tax=Brevundimonas TaxID=41275 RepID=UPI00289A32AA|nr:putative quinol monooxygenase [Brevundimonas vesicularis]
MEISRRIVVAGVGLAVTSPLRASAADMESSSMYGLIGKMTAQPGHRDELVRVLIEGVSGLPGCLSYIVALDPLEPEVIWITEAWQSKEAQGASLTLPAVRDAISRGRPMIAGMSRVAETAPAGGYGLSAPAH